MTSELLFPAFTLILPLLSVTKIPSRYLCIVIKVLWRYRSSLDLTKITNKFRDTHFAFFCNKQSLGETKKHPNFHHLVGNVAPRDFIFCYLAEEYLCRYMVGSSGSFDPPCTDICHPGLRAADIFAAGGPLLLRIPTTLESIVRERQ